MPMEDNSLYKSLLQIHKTHIFRWFSKSSKFFIIKLHFSNTKTRKYTVTT